MHTVLLTIHVIICAILMVVILLQSGKGAGIGASFGSGGSQTIFGGRGPATFFQKFTTITALIFLLTSVGLARLAKQESTHSVIDTTPLGVESAPAPKPDDAAPKHDAAPEPEKSAPAPAAPEVK